jgi:predicted Zn-dependent protease
MKSAGRALPLFLLMLLAVALPLRADEAAPDHKVKNIEQKFVNGDKRGAQRDARAWLKAEPKSPWPRVASACLAFHQKKYNRCLSLAAKALDRGPQNADAYYWRGRCFEAKGNALDAANEYRAALQAEAAYPPAHEGLARVEPSLESSDALPKAN